MLDVSFHVPVGTMTHFMMFINCLASVHTFPFLRCCVLKHLYLISHWFLILLMWSLFPILVLQKFDCLNFLTLFLCVCQGLQQSTNF